MSRDQFRRLRLGSNGIEILGESRNTCMYVDISMWVVAGKLFVHLHSYIYVFA